MNANFKRHTNQLQCATMLRGVILTVFFGVAGLSYVYLKNQQHVCGSQRKALEQDLAELKTENSAMETQIARLTSHTALQRKIDDGFIKMIPISNDVLVRVRTQDAGRWLTDIRPSDSQLQTISHETGPRR